MAVETTTRPATGSAQGHPEPHRRGLPITGWLLREHRRSTIGWAIALATVSAIYTSFFPAMDVGDMESLIASMPEQVITALGYDDLGSAAGYLSSTVYGLLGPALLLVFCVGFGARLIGGAEEEGLLELELTLPVSRRRALLERYAALGLRSAVLTLVVFATVAGLVVALDMDVALGNIAAASLQLWFLVLAIGSVAFAAGAATGRKAAGLAAGAGVAVAGFMADALAPLMEGAGWLSTISPFAWYLGGEPLAEGLDLAGSAALLGLTVVALSVAWVTYERRDLGV